MCRQPGRSFFIGFSITLAIIVAVWVAAYMRGINTKTERAVINNNVGYFQWQEKQYSLSGDAASPEIFSTAHDRFLSENGITEFSPELILDSHLATPEGDASLNLVGVISEQHQKFIPLAKEFDEGSYGEVEKPNHILIGRELAKTFKLKVNDNLVLNFQDAEGILRSELLTVGGIFHYSSKSFESKMVYVSQVTWQNLYFGMYKKQILFHRLPFMLPLNGADKKYPYPGLVLKSWKDLNPELAIVIEYNELLVLFFYVIIAITITLTIIIPIQMMWQERLPGLSMMNVLGTSSGKFWKLGGYETVLVFLGAVVASSILIWIIIGYQEVHGVDFTFMSKGIDMERSGVKLSWIIQPKLTKAHLGFAFLFAGFSVIISYTWAIFRTLKKLEVTQ